MEIPIWFWRTFQLWGVVWSNGEISDHLFILEYWSILRYGLVDHFRYFFSQPRVEALQPCKEWQGLFLGICPHLRHQYRKPYWIPVYTHSILHVTDDLYVMTRSYLILRAVPEIHEINALREVLWQQVGKFLLKSIIAFWQ